MRPPTHLGWTLRGLYPTIQNRGGHVTLYTRLTTVILFSCPQGSLGTRLGSGKVQTAQGAAGYNIVVATGPQIILSFYHIL